MGGAVPPVLSWHVWGHPLLHNTARQLNLCTKRVVFLCSVDCASLYNLVNETNLVHYLFLVYFLNFIYNIYMFQTFPGHHREEQLYLCNM